MIPHGLEIYVGLEAIDLRWGFDRLAGIVRERVGREARGGALFVFFGRPRDAIKVLFFDGTGMCVFYKRLDRGTFVRASTFSDSRCGTHPDSRPASRTNSPAQAPTAGRWCPAVAS